MSKKSTSNKIRRTSKRESSRGLTSKPEASRKQAHPDSEVPSTARSARQLPFGLWVSGLVASLGVFVWAYLPVFAGLVKDWSSIADYSHGFLVIPITLYLLWASRHSAPKASYSMAWPGLGLILLAALLRLVGAYYFFDPMQGWSIVVWVAGLVWTFFGWQMFLWSLAPIGFLFFMIRLPYSLDIRLGLQLQLVSTQVALFAMQCMGLPAVAEGTTILLNEHELGVERACSGLRIFMGITALAYAFLLLNPRPWLKQLLIVVAIVPITLVANTARIVVIALLLQAGWGEAAELLIHDFTGLFMIPFALLLFVVTLRYLDALLPQVEAFETESLIQRQVKSASTV